MKKLIVTISLIIIAFTASPQAVLEHTYTDQTISGPYKLTNFGWVYAAIHFGNPKDNIYIYSQGHSLLKTIPIQLPANYSFSQILNVSDNLFNSDYKIEVLYSINSTNPLNYKLILKNELGTILQEFDKQYYARIINMDGVFKMIGMTMIIDSNTYVYSLPGTMVDIYETSIQPDLFTIYPNPCTDHLFIEVQSYPAEFFIIDLNGRVIKDQTVINRGTIINTNDLSAGNYIYKIRCSSGKESIGKFVVNK